MRDGAADRAAMPHLWIADEPRRMRDDRAVLLHERVVRQVVMTCERPDRQLLARVAHVRELVDPADVDEQRRLREPELHERQERVTAREELRVIAPEELEGFVDGAGTLVVELCGDHRAPPFASAIARQTRSGLAGISMSVIP